MKVGKDIDSWCTRCKMMLAHTVEAMVGEKITRVHCNTCRTQHAYRAGPPGLRVAANGRKSSNVPRRTTRSARAGAVPRPPQDYATLIQSRDASKARPYGVSEHFALKELIKHPSFGLGVVTATRDGNKIEVSFPDGSKTLLHRR